MGPGHLGSRANKPSNNDSMSLKQDLERSRHTYEIIKANLLENTDRQLTKKNKNAAPVKIDVDDRVMIRKIKNSPGDNKLSPKFRGPYRVLSQKSPSIFCVKEIATSKELEVHSDNCKLVRERFADLAEFPDARLPLPWTSEINDPEQTSPIDPDDPTNLAPANPAPNRVTRSRAARDKGQGQNKGSLCK